MECVPILTDIRRNLIVVNTGVAYNFQVFPRQSFDRGFFQFDRYDISGIGIRILQIDPSCLLIDPEFINEPVIPLDFIGDINIDVFSVLIDQKPAEAEKK